LPAPQLIEALHRMLGDHVAGQEPLTPICVHTLIYGTRSSTILLIGEDRVERYLFAAGPPCVTELGDVTALLTRGDRARDVAGGKALERARPVAGEAHAAQIAAERPHRAVGAALDLEGALRHADGREGAVEARTQEQHHLVAGYEARRALDGHPGAVDLAAELPDGDRRSAASARARLD